MGGNFCILTKQICRAAIGCDHAREQVNRLLKIKGGVVGIPSNRNARVRFFLTAPNLAKFSHDLKELSGNTTQKNEKHHAM